VVTSAWEGSAAEVGNRRQLSAEIAAQLRDEVMSGKLRPGEFIRLEAVAQRLGTSVTPVREALLLLRGEDIVRLLPRRGFVVSPLSRLDVEDLFEVQARLAGELAARATAGVDDERIAKLDDINGRLTVAVAEGTPRQIQMLEYLFHRTLNTAAGSRKLAYLLRSASQYLPQNFYSADPQWRRAVTRDHKAILSALRAGDADGARDATAAHIMAGRERLLRHLDEVGFWVEADQAGLEVH
jgi:DNA-binding GntR family transcriptional regulator